MRHWHSKLCVILLSICHVDVYLPYMLIWVIGKVVEQAYGHRSLEPQYLPLSSWGTSPNGHIPKFLV